MYKLWARVACVAGGIVSVHHLGFGGGAVIAKKKVGTRGLNFSRLTPLLGASPPDLTRLLHNTASYAG